MNKNLEFFKTNYFPFIFSLIPLSLLLGPFVSDLNLIIISIIFLLYILIKKEYQYFKNIFFILFILWCLYLIIISLFSKTPLLSLESSLFYFRFGIFALSCYYLINNNIYFIKIFTSLLFLCFIFVLINSYIQFFFGYDVFGNIYNPNRMSSVFGDERVLGSYLSRLFPLLVALMFYLKYDTKKYVYFSILLFVMTDVIIFLSGERTAFFYLTFFSFLIILVINKWRLARFIAFIISLSIISLIAINNNNIKERMITNTINDIFVTEENVTKENFLTSKFVFFSSGHQQIYNTAFAIWQKNKLFGIGPKNYRLVCKDFVDLYPEGCSTHPHNTYIQLLTETGILGILPIIIILLCVSYLLIKHIFLKYFYKRPLFKDYYLCLLTCLLITLWPIAPTGNFFNNWLSVIYFLPLGFLIGLYKDSKIILEKKYE